MEQTIENITLEELTDCETLVMKVIWESEEVMSVQEITSRINQRYHRDWKIQTVSTFLSRAVKKGYLDMKRKGRTFHYYPKVTEEAYGRREITKCVDVWGGGKLENLIASFAQAKRLTEEEKMQIRSLIDDMD
ncbi:MAG: BlaI/MecI/CopY family transcriptional regulator [Lachnospiraceae bacterium]|nr:BlaI/MecI/CopY family transcriptional regulator [Lachnospiraceae bacterium]MBO5146041.1 BlaI/MecI/CopY family transcriptional regulator [Lachnospiraceae bacterium]